MLMVLTYAVTVVYFKVGPWPQLSPGDTDEYYVESHSYQMTQMSFDLNSFES